MKKKYLSPFEGEKLYTLVKTVIAGDARLKMRMVVDTRWNARPFVQTGQNGTGYWIMDPLEKEAYGFNVEWNGEFKSVAEIEAMLKPAMDVMQKWCDERDGLLDIMLGCTLYNHDVAKLPEARKVKALQTGRLCARFKYANEYIDGLKKAQKKKKLHESGLLSGQTAYERMRRGEKPLKPSFVLKTDRGTILVPVDMTLDELIGWNDRLGKGDVSSIKVVSKTDPKKLKESTSYPTTDAIRKTVKDLYRTVKKIPFGHYGEAVADFEHAATNPNTSDKELVDSMWAVISDFATYLAQPRIRIEDTEALPPLAENLRRRTLNEKFGGYDGGAIECHLLDAIDYSGRDKSDIGLALIKVYRDFFGILPPISERKRKT